MARSSSSRADDHDRLRLLATPSPRTSGAEKKESTDLRLSQACQRCATPSSISYFDRHLSDAHTAEDEAVKSRSNKSAKVVLGRCGCHRAPLIRFPHCWPSDPAISKTHVRPSPSQR